MNIKPIKNKEGDQLTTRDGEPMVECTLEPGDQIIPLFNSVREKNYTYDDNGQTKQGTNYLLQVKARDREDQPITVNGKDEIFLKLTKTQAKMLEKKKEEDGIDLTQHVFRAYTYENEYGKNVGIGYKRTTSDRNPVTFEEYDKKLSGEDGVEESVKENNPDSSAKKKQSPDEPIDVDDLDDLDFDDIEEQINK